MLLASVAVRLLAAGPDDLPPPDEGPGSAQRRAEEILDRAEFRRPSKSVLQRLWDWIGESIGDLLRNAGGGSALVAWAIVLVVAAAVAVLVVVVVRRLQADPVVRHDGVRIDDVGRPAADWRAEAARHEAVGAHRDALRCHWRALVADLATRGLLEEVPGRTTGEYRRVVARSVPGAAGPFSDATGLFEVAWYAAEEVDDDDVRTERALGDRVLAEARR